ncbi:MAG: hypothetical protein ICV70_03045 [Jiangellaceae bacterium]|nr:hypothetical protein [Jiangellaceae bacterium]
MTEGLLVANGVDVLTGDYLLPPMPVDQVARLAMSGAPDRSSAAALAARHRRATERVYAPKQGVDPRDLAQTGWGVVFAEHADPRIRSRLTPLLERRREQAAAVVERRYRQFTGADGYRAGESKQEFLSRHGAGPGPVDPDVVPYYLLLVGGPDEIPFEVQYQLDVQHAVGRIAFDDLDGYGRYAQNVVAAEQRSPAHVAPRLAFFAARHDGDLATTLSAEQLVLPLATELAAGSWDVGSMVGPAASKRALSGLLAGTDRPEVLFTATHGVGLPVGHPDQRQVQGGLVCQDWPGPGSGPLGPEYWFAGTDLPECDLIGLVVVLFACFGAGTPSHDDFGHARTGQRELAPRPFVAALPQALLGRDGGAMAVIGHVNRALGYSFVWPGVGRQTEVYRSTLAELDAGQPIGSAMEYLGDRYAELATELRTTLDEVELGRRADNAYLSGLWSAYTDARGFVLLGDPAVRLIRASTPVDRAATRSAPITITAGRTAPATGAEQAPLRPARADPIEVATYVTDDPAGVAYDPQSGRITGARLQLFSSVDVDGTAAHVVTTRSTGDDADPVVADLHLRLVQLSVAARQAYQKTSRRH